MVSNTSGEHNFSDFGRVKGDLRSSMEQERTDRIASAYEQSMSYCAAFDCEEFALAKARKTAIGN